MYRGGIELDADEIEILSFLGPVPPVDAQILQEQRRIIRRDNRNFGRSVKYNLFYLIIFVVVIQMDQIIPRN